MDIEIKKQRFRRLAVIEQKKYKDIAKELNVEEAQLSRWWDEIKTEREEINKVRQLWTRKNFSSLKNKKGSGLHI